MIAPVRALGHGVAAGIRGSCRGSHQVVSSSGNLFDAVARTVPLRPDRPALIFNDERHSLDSLLATADRVAGGLVAAGLQPGQSVSILSDNRRILPRYASGFIEAFSDHLRQIMPISKPTPARAGDGKPAAKRRRKR